MLRNFKLKTIKEGEQYFWPATIVWSLIIGVMLGLIISAIANL